MTRVNERLIETSELFRGYEHLVSRIGQDIKDNASQGATDQEWLDSQAMCVVEEAGEFIAEYRRLRGFARRAGDKDQMVSELADVVISATLMFSFLGESMEDAVAAKLKKIVSRGYVNKDE